MKGSGAPACRFPSEPVILPHRCDLICIILSDNSPLVPGQFVRAQRPLVAGHGGPRRRLWSRPASHAGPEAPANIATGPRRSQLFGGPARMHCLTRVKNDGNVRGTRITNTGLHDMGGILSLNKRGPAAVPGSPDHNGEPLVTVVVLNQVGIIRATRGKTSQIACISGPNAPVTRRRRPLLSRKGKGHVTRSSHSTDLCICNDLDGIRSSVVTFRSPGIALTSSTRQ